MTASGILGIKRQPSEPAIAGRERAAKIVLVQPSLIARDHRAFAERQRLQAIIQLVSAEPVGSAQVLQELLHGRNTRRIPVTGEDWVHRGIFHDVVLIGAHHWSAHHGPARECRNLTNETRRGGHQHVRDMIVDLHCCSCADGFLVLVALPAAADGRGSAA